MADERQLRDYLRRVTIELTEERERLHSYRHEPIAIVGMSCRYPGGVSSPRELWELLAEGRDGIGPFPSDRGWDLDRLYDPDPEHPGTSYVRDGGFMAEPAHFDAEFFGIGPREAKAMDPQQRLLLETCWEALEDAGVDPTLLREQEVGVFAGVMYHDYASGSAPSPEMEGHLVTGLAGSVASGRVAYNLGLEGPAMSVDTACSSSLVTLHLASQALRSGECTLALAGGVTLLATPGTFTGLSRQRALSPDGRCKSFAEAADGVGWAEGVGMLALERLADAERNDHPIFAVIRGSAVNQDGASNGLTAPNGPSQERVIRQALANARLAPKDVDAIEAHGTGTMLGDPIEAGALLATYGQDRETPLRLGSIKSNIGHTQAAAGVAGVIKMALAMREGVLPQTLHVDAPSSKVDWEAGKIELLTEQVPWEAGDRPRRAGISSFSISGTNAHLVLEEAPEPSPAEPSESGGDAPAEVERARPFPAPTLLSLSAKTGPALAEAGARLSSHLRQNPDLDPADVSHSLLARTSFEQRAVALGESREELLGALDALAESTDAPNLARGAASGSKRVAFLYPGQGSQWQGMGVELLDSSPAFAEELKRCEEALSPHIDWSVQGVLRGEEGAPSIERIEVVQPVLFAVMASLTALWRSCGVHPAAVAGHSQGEIVAAYACGGLTLEDAAMLAAVRSKLISKLAGKGGLVSVSLPSERLSELLANFEGRIEVAAQNGPASTILSGDRDSLDELLGRCEEEEIRAREVPAAVASHSAHVESLREEVLEAFASISPRASEIPFHSTVTGGPLDTKELDATYWYRNLRQPVLFERVTRGLLEEGHRVLVEVSPHPVFALAVGETIEAALPEPGAAAVLGTLRREEGGPERFALSLAQAHVNGASLDWAALLEGANPERVPLPTYPFQRKRYWLSASAGAGDLSTIGQSAAEHPLLGASVSLAEGDARLFTGRLSLETHPWIADHAVAGGTVLLPGTAFVELALRAGREAGAETLRELTLQAPLILAEQGSVQVQVNLGGPGDEGEREVSIHSRPEGEEQGAAEWTCHATGVLSSEAPEAPKPLSAWPPEGAQPLEVEGLYDRLADAGFEYGPAFQGLTSAWRRGEEIFAEVSLAPEQREEAERFGIHPALLDSSFHIAIDLALTSLEGEGAGRAGLALPFAWHDVSVVSSGASSLRICVSIEGETFRLAGLDEGGAPVASVGSVLARPVEQGQLQAAARQNRPIYRVEWSGVEPRSASDSEPPALAILGEAEIEGLEGERHPGLPALLAAIEAGAVAPAVVLADFRALEPGGEGLAEDAHAATRSALESLQGLLEAEALSGTRLAILTEGAIVAGVGEDPDLATAPLAGLIRSAHSEFPGRFGLIDLDGSEASLRALGAALRIDEEPQIALREGIASVPRLARAKAGEGEPTQPIDPDTTVLISGGTSGLGALVARHLVEEHGARHLLLASRRGEEAEGAAELRAELEELGAEVRIAACDFADREQVRELIDSIPSEHPLGAVIHSAAVLDDGVLASLDAERLEAVMAPKVDAAWNLHELTAGMELSQFLLFSSGAGVLGGAAQANYAAANAFLDALAAHRHVMGLPAASLAWGLWAQQSSLASDWDEAQVGRMLEQIRVRLGFSPMPPEQGLELFDAARALPESLLLPGPFDNPALRSQASTGTLPAILRGLVRTPARREGETSSLAKRLAGVAEAEREAVVLEMVRSHAAAVLGHDSPEEIDPDRAFRDHGFDSLGAVELRNRLAAVTGLRLAPALVFDYPNPRALASFLLGQAQGLVSAAPVAIAASSNDEPVAIVGMSCRFPGGANSPEQLWQLLQGGQDGISGFPADRGWDLERLHGSGSQDPGIVASEAGFLYDAAEFDPAFFGISPREAVAMDPQQRLLLEASWHALEDAGIDPAGLHGGQAGVFAGVVYHGYGLWINSSPEQSGYTGPGGHGSLASGLVAYHLGLEGPAITVDTACSSSLVALHLAAQALRQGECSLALAGGVTVLSSPSMLIQFSQQGALAPNGRCKAFAEVADGTSLADGVGMLVLERLSEAERNGHPVLAVIRGSAINQDGASNGITAPNGPSQERVIRQALANARLEPGDVDAVEAHGTGTTLGDPIEAGALLATYGQDRETPLKLGSIKSNIGHTQAAAGVAGVIKMALALREGVMPQTLHVDAPSSNVDWEAGRIELLTQQVPWQTDGRPRRAGISSFGASGTNAHLILEQAPEPSPAESSEGGGDAPVEAEQPQPLPGPIPLVLSAKTEPALREAAVRLASHLRQNPDLDPTDVAWSLTSTRSVFEQRAVALGEGREELLDALAVLVEGGSSPNALTAKAKGGKLAYLFTGQGAQRLDMGRELYETHPAFRGAFDLVCEHLDPLLETPLKEIVFAKGKKAEKALEDTTYAQPALFAIEVALFRALESQGLAPNLLAGHSVGEISAAHVSGVLSLPDACKLIAARGKLMGELPAGGAMVAIEATEAEAEEYLEGREAELAIAAINGPMATVLSGTGEAIEAAQAHWKERERKTKRLAVSHAFHSPLIEPMLDPFSAIAQGLQYQEPQIPIVSNVTGEVLGPEQATDPEYWVSHARSAVRFADSVATLQRQGASAYLELGPDPVLIAMAEGCLEDDEEPALIPTLRDGRPEPASLVSALSAAHVNGAEVEWDLFFKVAKAKRVKLPAYPFQRKRYWLSSAGVRNDAKSIGLASADHPLLGAAIEDPRGEGLTLTGRLSIQTHPWLADHAVAGTVLLPGTAFVELALRAGREAGAETLRELTLQAPLAFPEQGAAQIQLSVGDCDDEGSREVSIHSRFEGGEAAAEWTCHATGVLSAEPGEPLEPLPTWPPEGAEPIEVDGLYERLADAGFEYGPAFQRLGAAWRDGEEIFAEVSLTEEQTAEAQRFGIHPALLDSSFHALLDLALATASDEGEEGGLALPFAWSGVHLDVSGASSLRVRLTQLDGAHSIAVFDETGAPLASIDSVLARPVERGQLQAAARHNRPLYRLEWAEPQPAPSNGSAPPAIAILGETGIDGAERYPDLDALLGAIEAGADAPEILLADLRREGAEEDLPASAHASTKRALELMQALLGAEPLAQTRLAILIEGALTPGEEEGPDLSTAPLSGLVRSAHSEHPGRFCLIDLDGSTESLQSLGAALAIEEEPQIALREGIASVPRLAPAKAGEGEPTQPIDPDTTVLISGGTSGLGALVARHLATEHGARHLLLASRRGEEAEGAAELRAELEELGAEVRIAACDFADRARVEELLGSIPAEHPLGAVIHSAAVLDDGVLASLDAERLQAVMAPKVDAAWNLHELTAGMELSQFLLFSSAAGLLGNAGQANYAAANTFLDALAHHRRAKGLPATSIAWGGLAQRSEMTDALSEADLSRLGRLGFVPMPSEQALELFDAALSMPEPVLAPVAFDTVALRSRVKAGALAPVLRGIVRVPARREREGGSLAKRLAEVPEAGREAVVLELVRSHVATTLGHASAAEVEPDRAFQELGFDSLAAVELRNRLGTATGLTLSPTLVFDYPNAGALAKFLLAEAQGLVQSRAPAPIAATSHEEPIAILGMACRYPGGARSPQELWQLVASGTDAISAFPADRGWDLERLYDPDPDIPGTSYAREGGFVHDAAEFDPGFFGIAPREALGMDPQQRLLLEAAWEALEDAGLDPAELRGSRTGMFAGAMYYDYGWGIESSPELGGHGPTVGVGSSLSGRVSYVLGLEGPTMSIDTACSSSLVAMHLGAQALRQGECSLVLAGGATVLSTPRSFTEFSSQRGLAPDGRSKAFAEAADGVGWSEGVGVLVLERLSEAERNGHPILAVIRGSAVNQDGASNGFTAPNGPSQERVIRQALANAGLEPKDVDAVEAHGTGTTLGDPIEAGALLATYGQERETPLKLGSIKSNIGHTQAAAGVAGVIKTVMAMRAGVLPQTLHVDAPSSNVDWEAGEIELLTEAQDWESNGKPRRAGVSSFGATGTNAHLILEEAPEPAPEQKNGDGDGIQAEGAAADAEQPQPLAGPIPLPLSAKTEPALRDAASRLATHLKADPDLDPTDVAYSLITTRSSFEHRAVALGKDREELLGSLSALAGGRESPRLAKAKARAERSPAFLFPGQGAQHAQMALELLEASPTFASHVEECEAALSPYVDWSLTEVLREEDGKWLGRLDVVQPALFAVMVSLARLWQSAGVKPAVVVGHSQGEIAAAHIAGGLSLEDAARIIALRAKAMSKIAGRGGMLSVSLPVSEIEPRLKPYAERLSLAAINGPASLVVSGEPEALEELQDSCEAEGIRAQKIAVDYAAHSSQIEELEDELLEAFEPISPQSGEIPFHSTLTGELLDTKELNAEYWYRNLRETVRLEPVLRSLLEQGQRNLIEIGPHPVLGFSVEETIEDVLEDNETATVLGTLRREEGTPERFGLSLAEAHTNGMNVEWEAFFEGTNAKAVRLPTYPFQRKRYWLNASAGAGNLSAAGLGDADHPLLGAAIEDPQSEGLTLTGRLSLQSHPWLSDHAVAGTVLLPGTAFVELALRAGEEVEAPTLQELTLQAPLVFAEGRAVQIQVSLGGPDEEGNREVEIHSRPEGGSEEEAAQWTCHARGVLSDQAAEPPEPMATWPPEGAEPLQTEGLYDRLADAGFEYGPAFQGLTAAWKSGEEIFAEVSLAPEQKDEAARFGIHPALLDSSFHAVVDLAIARAAEEGGGGLALPFAWSGVSFEGSGASALRVRLTPTEGSYAIAAFDEQGDPVAFVDSVLARPVEPSQLAAAAQRNRPLYRIEWEKPEPAPTNGSTPPTLAILGAEGIEGAEHHKDLRSLLEGIEAGGKAPEILLADFRSEEKADNEELPGSAHEATRRALELLQGVLFAEPLSATRLAILTEGALTPGEAEDPDLATAPLAGLLGSAHSEHPGRFCLIDVDGPDSLAGIGAALGLEDEPLIALREGGMAVPRLTRAEESAEATRPIDPESTVLISGGTSGLGALVARHLAKEHGARHLILASRRGEGTEGAGELRAELRELGAEATIAACDFTDRDQLEALIDSIPSEHPLGAVIHSAAVLDDGILSSLDAERLQTVMAPKVDAAWNLHELTKEMELSQFLLFSSAGGLLGNAAQANYAAANAFIDALAAHRQRQGLPATSIAWGGWAQQSEMTGVLSDAGRARLARLGFAPMASEQVLELFDAARSLPQPLLAPVAFDNAALRSRAKDGAMASILGKVIHTPARRERQSESLQKRLQGVPEAEREAVVLELVRSHAATVLGYSSAEEVEPDRAFQELGFDSLGAVELRNRLGAATGLRLPPTLVFDYPNSRAVASHLMTEVGFESGDRGLERERSEAAFRDALARVPLSRLREAGLMETLVEFLELDGIRGDSAKDDLIDRVESMDIDDLVEQTLERHAAVPGTEDGQ